MSSWCRAPPPRARAGWGTWGGRAWRAAGPPCRLALPRCPEAGGRERSPGPVLFPGLGLWFFFTPFKIFLLLLLPLPLCVGLFAAPCAGGSMSNPGSSSAAAQSRAGAGGAATSFGPAAAAAGGGPARPRGGGPWGGQAKFLRGAGPSKGQRRGKDLSPWCWGSCCCCRRRCRRHQSSPALAMKRKQKRFLQMTLLFTAALIFLPDIGLWSLYKEKHLVKPTEPAQPQVSANPLGSAAPRRTAVSGGRRAAASRGAAPALAPPELSGAVRRRRGPRRGGCWRGGERRAAANVLVLPPRWREKSCGRTNEPAELDFPGKGKVHQSQTVAVKLGGRGILHASLVSQGWCWALIFFTRSGAFTATFFCLSVHKSYWTDVWFYVH